MKVQVDCIAVGIWLGATCIMSLLTRSTQYRPPSYRLSLIHYQETNRSQTSIQVALSIRSIQDKILIAYNAERTDIVLSLNPMISNLRQRMERVLTLTLTLKFYI
jgi:hypothetical protein